MAGKKGVTVHQWTDAERDYLAEIAPGRTHAEIRALMTERFGDHYGGSRITAALKRYRIKTGLTGRFEKGHEPFNKGKTWDDYGTPEGHARSRATCFKPGQVSGITAMRVQPVGTERVTKDGYVEVKVAEGLQERPNSNFRLKHHVVYENAYGPIPHGCNVVFADGDKRNFDPDNLVAVPRALWATISHSRMPYYDRESLETCMALATMRQRVYAMRMHPRRCRECGETFEPDWARQRTCNRCLGKTA